MGDPIHYNYDDLDDLAVVHTNLARIMRKFDTAMTQRAGYLVGTGFGREIGLRYTDDCQYLVVDVYKLCDKLSDGLKKTITDLQATDQDVATKFNQISP